MYQLLLDCLSDTRRNNCDESGKRNLVDEEVDRCKIILTTNRIPIEFSGLFTWRYGVGGRGRVSEEVKFACFPQNKQGIYKAFEES